ncbi:MAG: hypothetical protein ACKVJU_12420 [Verrucomicrobiales bacterium]
MFLRSFLKNDFGKTRYAGWEWAIMRSVFCVLLWLATTHRLLPIPIDIHDQTDQEKGNGFANLFNLDWIGQPGTETIIQIIFLILLVIYAIGKWPLFISGGLLVIHTLIGSIYSSPAKDHHASQIIGMVLLGQFIWFAWEAIRNRFYPKLCADGHDRPSGAIFLSQQLIAAAYTVSAISKWVNSGGGIIPGAKWISQVPNIAVQFEKTNQQAYFDTLQAPANAEFNQLSIDFVINYPVLAMIVFGSAFYLEFFAILALWNRKIGLIYGLGLIALHLGIDAVMHLKFFNFEAVVFVFFVNLPFWISRIGKKKTALNS